MGLKILATGRALPSRLVTNDDLAQVMETSDEWIASRTGIRQRYFCGEGEGNTALAVSACRQALARAGIDPAEIGLCLAATFTPDHASPSLACEVHGALGLPESTPAFDINAACTGFLAALETARCLLAGGNLRGKYALVFGSEVISRVLDPADRSTAVLFGDGTGAAVVTLSKQHPFVSLLGARGDAEILRAGGSGQADQYVRMEGKAVFRFATQILPACIDQLLERAGCGLDEVDWVVCHQANGRIIDHVVRKLGAPEEKFYKNIHRYANTSAASIPIALDEMCENGLIRAGQRVLCVGFGAGLTWGGALLTF